MIIPCIDLQDGKAVQLVRGRRRALAVDDVLGLLDRFRDYPILHVIDLDAAMRKGSNARWIKLLCQRARTGKCASAAESALCARAEKFFPGARKKSSWAARRSGTEKWRREFLRALAERVGRKHVIIALDTEGGRIVVRGWRER